MTEHRKAQYNRTIRRLRMQVFCPTNGDRAVYLIDRIKDHLKPEWKKEHRKHREQQLERWLTIQ